MLLIWLGTPWLAFQVYRWTRYVHTCARCIGVPLTCQAANVHAVTAESVAFQRIMLLLLHAT